MANAAGGWNDGIIEEFRANDGKVGGYFAGAPMILIHHVGARSGTERVSPLVYLPDGDDMVIAATKGGAPTNPDWCHNLRANPRITVEVGTDSFRSRSRRRSRVTICAPARRTAPRPQATVKTSRVFPMFRLRRAA